MVRGGSFPIAPLSLSLSLSLCVCVCVSACLSVCLSVATKGAVEIIIIMQRERD